MVTAYCVANDVRGPPAKPIFKINRQAPTLGRRAQAPRRRSRWREQGKI